MSRAQGSLLRSTWKKSQANGSNILQESKANVVFQLGVLEWQLSRLCFDQAVTLLEADNEFHIKTCLLRGLVLDGRDGVVEIPCSLLTL